MASRVSKTRPASDKAALIASWVSSMGDKRKAAPPAADDEWQEEGDDVSTFAAFSAKERQSIADLGIKADEEWILAEINRRWESANGGKVEAKPKTETSSSKNVKKAKGEEEVSVEILDIKLPDDAAAQLGLEFVGAIRDKFMYKPIVVKAEPDAKLKAEPEAKEKLKEKGDSSKSPAKVSKLALKPKGSPAAVKSAIGKGKGKAVVKPAAAKASPEKKPVGRPRGKAAMSKLEKEHEHWSTICAARIMDKMMCTDEGRAWVESGLELFKANDVAGSDDQDRVSAVELARQLTSQTDDEAEEDEEEEDAAMEEVDGDDLFGADSDDE